MNKNFRQFVPIIIIILVSLLASEIDFSNITTIYMTTNSIIIFGLIPFLMLLVSFSIECGNLVIVREGRKKLYVKTFANYCASFMIFVIYIGSILFSNNFMIIFGSFLMYLLQVIIIYLTIFNITFLLSSKKIFKYYSILYGIIISSIYIYLSYVFINIMLYSIITFIFLVNLILSFVLLKQD